MEKNDSETNLQNKERGGMREGSNEKIKSNDITYLCLSTIPIFHKTPYWKKTKRRTLNGNTDAAFLHRPA